MKFDELKKLEKRPIPKYDHIQLYLSKMFDSA